MVKPIETQNNEEGKGFFEFLRTILSSLPGISDKECNCPECQMHRWEEADKVMGGMQFEEGKTPQFVLFLEHHRKVEKLLELREALRKEKNDTSIWEKIIKQHDSSAFEHLSEEAQKWLKIIAYRTFEKVLEDKEPGYEEVLVVVDSFINFINLLAGKTKLENKGLNEILEECRKIVLEHDTSEIEKEIADILKVLPEEYHDATEVPRLKIPLEELEAAIRSHILGKNPS